jgi:hypothetical protein
MNVELIVRHPSGRLTERRYVYEQVLNDWLGLKVLCQPEDRSDVLIELQNGLDSRSIRVSDMFLAMLTEHWLNPLSLPSARPVPLHGARSFAANQLEEEVLLPWSSPEVQGFVKCSEDGSVDIQGDLFGAIFFFITRYEEVVIPSEDRFGRFPLSNSWAGRNELIERPVVDEYLAVLRTAIQHVWPQLPLREPPSRTYVSHDVDLPLRYRWSNVLRTAGGGLRDWRRAGAASGMARRMSDWYAVRHCGELERDPYNTFEKLISCSERWGMPSAYYFIAERTSKKWDGLYEIDDPFIFGLIGRLGNAGQEIGLHPSFCTWLDPEQTQREYMRLVKVCKSNGLNTDVMGGRQHFLRWRAPTTWLNWEAVGLRYDSSLGYAERAGFRAGTSREFRAFDVIASRKLALIERPLIVMDSTFLNYMMLGATDAAIECGLRLKYRCKRLGGNFTLLWHNSNLTTDSHWRVFQSLVES